MESRTFGRIKITPPGLTEPGLYLSRVESLESGRGTVQEFQYADANLRELDLAGTQLITGRITGLRAARVRFEAVNLYGVELDACDLGSAQWTGSKLTRVVLRHCKIMGAALDDLVLDDVLFDRCKLDYTDFTKVRVAGPVAFSGCGLTEASLTDCDLSDAVMRGCTLRDTEFGRGRYQGLDLRDNDLATLRGVASLNRVLIDRAQQDQLAQALMAELDVTYGDD
ncbi:pentapeptide repeat-containing protein [Streptomyces roseoverticillatus]|uniref:pentapeptide repeat-containing protein n=1 Tax=Streptomyces roseoverticillatus TaxID=66429 RepID=UPI001F24B738|nr:pentapeptide repeat-containing protein [Streptomyces roseoverticillatus]MCF3107106.1 pentapeptide repeat-containing protein [Streptomyces roseoverticillatus]